MYYKENPKFPEGFMWGASSAAWQVEGGVADGGRTPAMIDLNSKKKKPYADDSICADHYHRYKEDVALMAECGFSLYRFSISWSRIIPHSDGKVNPEGIAFYNDLINELVKNGITPIITLYHYDLQLAALYEKALKEVGEASAAIFSPTEEEMAKAEDKIKKEQEKKNILETLKGKETVTREGKKINLYANIGSVSNVGYVMENDAAGIGLFRSEFLYLGRDTFPTEEEQLQAYRQVLRMMGGKKVIIRTLDIGADKKADYFELGEEENPALGYRAIRICLTRPEIFKTQLRALFRAAVYGNLSVMYPMITSVWEVEKIYEIAEEVKKELEEQQIPFQIPEQGIMIETPAAVMISDELAELVDFFSIGTNDLTQYTLAVDRQNAKLDLFYNPHHKAILKMIEYVTKQAHAKGKWVGICGELGADLELTETFLNMGIDELSVSPSMVLKVGNVSGPCSFTPAFRLNHPSDGLPDGRFFYCRFLRGGFFLFTDRKFFVKIRIKNQDKIHQIVCIVH